MGRGTTLLQTSLQVYDCFLAPGSSETDRVEDACIVYSSCERKKTFFTRGGIAGDKASERSFQIKRHPTSFIGSAGELIFITESGVKTIPRALVVVVWFKPFEIVLHLRSLKKVCRLRKRST